MGAVWDSRKWASDFAEACAMHDGSGKTNRLRELRRAVFTDTVSRVKEGHYISEHGLEVDIPLSNYTTTCSELFSEPVNTGFERKWRTSVFVENCDCLESARAWQALGYDTAVLNMASRQHPGGGVLNGAGAQEENLFRRTELFRSLYLYDSIGERFGVDNVTQYYPLDRNYGGIYTPEAVVFRGLESDGYPLLDRPFITAFISVPGMNRPRLDENGMIVAQLVEGVKNKMRTIFNMGALHGHDCLILGALGCGAFRNPPEHIARLFREVIDEEFPGVFKVIVFAIIDDHNTGKAYNKRGNYLPFLEAFRGFEESGNRRD